MGRVAPLRELQRTRAPALAEARDTATVLGCRIDRLDMDATVARSVAAIESREVIQHMAINAAKIVAMRRDPTLRRIVDNSGLVSADGQAIVWAAKLLGDPLPERVAGIDLMDELLRVSEERSYRVYILGAKPQVLERAVARLRAKYPRLEFAGWRHGYFYEEEEAEVVEEIRGARPDILLVAIASPKKEYFLATFGERLQVPFMMGVGGAVDVAAGITRRAPERWQRAGLEWLYRFVQEPRRMFRRYAVTNTVFIALVLRALVTGRLPTRD